MKALSITLDDGIMFGKDFEDFVADNPDADGAGGGEDEYDDEYDEYDEDDDVEDNAKGYDDVRSGLVEEKVAAIRAIKSYAESAPRTYVQAKPRLKNLWKFCSKPSIISTTRFVPSRTIPSRR